MLLERMGETVTLERADGTTTEVRHVLCAESSNSDQTVMDVQTRFINQARYKGDSLTISVMWPKDAPHDLMDAHLWIRGERFAVYASPFPVAHSPNGYDTRLAATRSLFLYEARMLASVQTRDAWGVAREDFDGPTVKANLLRLSDDAQSAAGRTDMARIVLLELEPGSWDESYTAFEFQGHFHRIESIDYAGDVVVIGGTREVAHA